jgi:hypothetical protein
LLYQLRTTSTEIGALYWSSSTRNHLTVDAAPSFTILKYASMAKALLAYTAAGVLLIG